MAVPKGNDTHRHSERGEAKHEPKRGETRGEGPPQQRPKQQPIGARDTIRGFGLVAHRAPPPGRVLMARPSRRVASRRRARNRRASLSVAGRCARIVSPVQSQRRVRASVRCSSVCARIAGGVPQCSPRCVRNSLRRAAARMRGTHSRALRSCAAPARPLLRLCLVAHILFSLVCVCGSYGK